MLDVCLWRIILTPAVWLGSFSDRKIVRTHETYDIYNTYDSSRTILVHYLVIMEKIGKSVTYAPPEDVRKFLENFSRGDRSPQQVITYALRHLMMNQRQDIERILLKHWSGTFDDHELDLLLQRQETKPELKKRPA